MFLSVGRYRVTKSAAPVDIYFVIRFAIMTYFCTNNNLLISLMACISFKCLYDRSHSDKTIFIAEERVAINRECGWNLFSRYPREKEGFDLKNGDFIKGNASYRLASFNSNCFIRGSRSITSHYLPSRIWIQLSSFHLASFFRSWYICVVTDIINVLCRILLYCVGFSALLSASAIVLSTFVPSLLCKIHIRIKTLYGGAVSFGRYGEYIGVVFSFRDFSRLSSLIPPRSSRVSLLRRSSRTNMRHRESYVLTNFVD